MTLGGKTFLVTGGTSGLGEACVRSLVAAGATVVFVGLSETRGAKLANELGAAAKFCRADICSEAAMQQAIGLCERLDGVIHCAGIAPSERVLGRSGPLPLERIERVFRVNAIGTLNVVRLAAAKMSANQPSANGERGVIILTSSIAAYDGQIGQAAYAASKGAVVAMTLPLAREFAQLGIRVVGIAPGLFQTRILEDVPPGVIDRIAETVPFPSRMGDPAEFAALALHIIGNQMMNGEVIRLDAGLRMERL
jgi:NAD(P)-dependent dehydrogenase (short-subunit alcohol dehydrogenase family)